MSALKGLLMARAAARYGEPESVVLGHLQSGLASASWDESKAVLVEDDWCVYLDGSLARWEVYVDETNQRIFVHEDTWETIGWDGMAQQRFVDDFIDAGVSGLRFIVADAGPYAVAARRQAEAAGSAAPAQKDRLVQLAERANALIVQAASLNTTATAGQSQIFAVRYAKLREELAALEAEMDRVRGMIELAAVAMLDATS